jgi:hypothetical protein
MKYMKRCAQMQQIQARMIQILYWEAVTLPPHGFLLIGEQLPQLVQPEMNLGQRTNSNTKRADRSQVLMQCSQIRQKTEVKSQKIRTHLK